MMAAAIGMIIVALALLIFCVAVMWKVFCKAGEPGWASLIPFYNLYVMTRITWGKEGWICLWADFLKYCLSSNPCVWKGRVYRSGSGEKYRSDHSQCDHWRNRYHSVGT